MTPIAQKSDCDGCLAHHAIMKKNALPARKYHFCSLLRRRMMRRVPDIVPEPFFWCPVQRTDIRFLRPPEPFEAITRLR